MSGQCPVGAEEFLRASRLAVDGCVYCSGNFDRTGQNRTFPDIVGLEYASGGCWREGGRPPEPKAVYSLFNEHLTQVYNLAKRRPARALPTVILYA